MRQFKLRRRNTYKRRILRGVAQKILICQIATCKRLWDDSRSYRTVQHLGLEEEQEQPGEEEMEEQGDQNYKVFKIQPGLMVRKQTCLSRGR